MSQSTQTPGWGPPPTTAQPPKPKRRIPLIGWVGIALVVFVIWGIAATQGDDSASTPTTVASLAPVEQIQAGQLADAEAAFVAKAKTLSFGNKDLAGTSDKDLLAVGNSIVDAIQDVDVNDDGTGMAMVVQGLVDSDAHPTKAEARALITAAITNLDPARSYLLDAMIKTPPTTTKPKPAAPEYGEGVYKVGTDIKPGLYKATVTSGMGYWARLADPDGNNILANDVKTSGTMYLRVRTTDRYIEISGTTFVKVG